ncbi:MAG TPA: thioesterase family protein [Nitrolancea sp.]|jgi:acyl-CoA thioester hydrolase|nr:thioesterase family protein [Nitrolancea sp.]
MSSDSGPPFAFWYRERVRFRDVDLQQIVYYGKYLDYFDNALYEYLRSLGFETSGIDARHGFDTSVVHVEIDYVSPATFDDLLEIGLRVTRLGRSSFDVRYEIRVAERVVCRAQMVLVNFDARLKRARPIPDAIRTAIEASNLVADRTGGRGQAGLDTIRGA